MATNTEMKICSECGRDFERRTGKFSGSKKIVRGFKMVTCSPKCSKIRLRRLENILNKEYRDRKKLEKERIKQ